MADGQQLAIFGVEQEHEPKEYGRQPVVDELRAVRIVQLVKDCTASVFVGAVEAGEQQHERLFDLVRQLFGGKVSDLAIDIILMTVACRWSAAADLVLALEQLADQAAFTVAEADGSLNATEEEIFLFGRALDSSSALQMALTDPAQSAETKAGVVRDLLQGRSTAATQQVLEYAVGHLHGRRIDAVVDELCGLAAKQRERLVAEVRVAAPLDETQERRLAEALGRLKGRTVQLNVAVDPAVLGGVHVRIGDEVIDGTIASRMEQARRALLG